MLGRFPQMVDLFLGNQIVGEDHLDFAARFGNKALDLPLQFLHPIPFRIGEERAGKVNFHGQSFFGSSFVLSI